MRISWVAKLAGPLCLAVLLITGCGGSDDSESGYADRPAPPASSFPSTQGRSLAQLLEDEATNTTLVVTPTERVFYKGENRFGFGVFTRSAHEQVGDAEIALYAAKAPTGSAPNGQAGLEFALGGRARGPFPAEVLTLETEGPFTAKTTADDPDSGKVVYTTNIDFPSNGEWRIAAMIRNGDELEATLLPSAVVGQFTTVPRVGERPPAISTPTFESVGGNRSELTTRIPPEAMAESDFADVLGKKPVALLFATPQFCESRVCGPVVDVAAQVQRDYEDEVEFIHMEIYNDNDPGKGVRPQLRAFNLPSEPWLFVVDRKGMIRTAIEGAFGVSELSEAVQGVTSK